jgi:hypothetical protein
MSTDTFRRYLDLLNEAETANPLQDLIKPRTDGGNYIDPKTGFIMYVPTKNARAGLDAPDPDPKPLTLGLLKQPEAQEIKKALAAAGLEIISAEKPSLFGSYPVAAVDPEKLARALAGNDRQNAEIAAADNSTVSRVSKKDGGVDFRTGEIKGDSTAADSSAADSSGTIRSGDALGPSGSGGAEDGPGLAGNTHCAQCGTPKSMHQGLQHKFVQGDDARPDPVSQTGDIGGNEKADRIRKMQEELKKAGADLGNFGPNGDGIDGVIGKVTQAAMAKYPEIAKKYPELASGGGENKEAKVDVTKLNTALSAIESILKKYKVKINEDQESQTSTDQMKNWRALMEAPPTLTPAQQAAQRAGLGIPRLAGAPAFGAAGSSAAGAAATGSTAMKTAGALGKGVAKLSPGLGAALAIPDVYSRAKEGDYVGAGISTLAGLASFFPLAGTAAALGLTGLNYYLDSNKTPTVAISAEDAKIIGDNIKIIQDWQKDPANKDALSPELKTRIANDLKGVAALGVPTQSSEPAPADAPAAGGSKNAIPAAAADLNTTLDKMDKFLAKHQFESARKDLLKNQHLLSETERMALHRDLLKEDWSDWLPDLAGAAIGSGAATAAGNAARRTAPAASAIPTPAPSVFKSLLSKAWSGIKLVGRGAARVGWWGVLIAGGIAAKSFWDWIRSDPHAAAAAGLTPQEMAEWQQLDDQMNKLIPDRETFDALPFETQKKAMLINERRVKFMAWVTEKAEQQAKQQPK